MKRFVAVLLVLTMVLSLTSVAFAKEKKFDGVRVKFTGSAYGYKQAGANRSKVIVKKGSYTKSIKSKIKGGKEWVLIKVDDIECDELWFSADYLAHTSKKGTMIVFAGGGSGRSEVAGSKTWDVLAYDKKQHHVQATGNVNIRKKACLDSEICGVLRKGKKLYYTQYFAEDDREVLFYQVRYNGKNRWVSSKYTKIVK